MTTIHDDPSPTSTTTHEVWVESCC
jgi:hypothetical protein